MPIYDFECPQCGIHRNLWAGMDEEEKLCSCMSWMKRIISAPDRGRFSINPDFAPYWDENLGQAPVFVQSRKHRRQLMGEKGLVDKYTSTSKQRWV